MDWFLYDKDHRHEGVKASFFIHHKEKFTFFQKFEKFLLLE